MGQVNIYRISPPKYNDFNIRLQNDFLRTRTKKIKNGLTSYDLTFYYQIQTNPKEISWSWIFDEYRVNTPTVAGAPKGVLTISSLQSQSVYAVTFGTAFFCVDKFCDRDFGFEYACRVPYSNIRLTALTNPISVRNKTINSYQNCATLEFDSGESFAKIKATMGVFSGDDFLKDTIEVGTALKFQLKSDSLDNIVKLVLHIEKVLKAPRKTPIPRFNVVRDKTRIERLQQSLIAAIKGQLPQVIISEFGIIGSCEIFNRCDSYELSYKHHKAVFSDLNFTNIIGFCEKYHIDTPVELLHIKVGFIEDGQQKNQTTLLSTLDFMDEKERCLLVQGEWYEFNDDYLDYLKNSLSEIPVFYNPRFDLSQSQLDNFREQKASEEKDDAQYKGLSFEAIKKAMKTKYYAERAFNAMRVSDGFILGDRKPIPIGNAIIEVDDLYRDDTIFSVKRGNSSADFSYVADQSSMAINAYKSGSIPNVGGIKKIVIWLIFTRSQKLSLHGNLLEWDELNMLILKNRLDQWKKEVRLAGFQPEIWINYQN